MLSLILRTDKFFMGQDCWITASFPAKRLLIRSHQIRGSVVGGRGEPSPMSSWKWEGMDALFACRFLHWAGSGLGGGARLTCTLQKFICALDIDCPTRKLCQQHKLMQQLWPYVSFQIHLWAFWISLVHSISLWQMCFFLEKMTANVKLLIIAKCFSLQEICDADIKHRTY